MFQTYGGTCICLLTGLKKELLNGKNLYVGKINSYFNYRIKKINKERNIGGLYLEGPTVSRIY